MCACMYVDVMYTLSEHYKFVYIIKVNTFKVIGEISNGKQPSCTEATVQGRVGPVLWDP